MGRKAIIHRCEICGAEDADGHLVPIGTLRPSLKRLLRNTRRDFNPRGYICTDDLNELRSSYINEIFKREIQNVTKLEQLPPSPPRRCGVFSPSTGS